LKSTFKKFVILSEWKGGGSCGLHGA